MQSLPDNKPYIIYLSYGNKEREKELRELIINKIKNVIVRIFSCKTIDTDPGISNADLIIIDLISDKNKLEKIHERLIKVHHRVTTPYLLMVDSETFKNCDLSILDNYSDLVYDFVNETCFQDIIFINRIKVCLSIPKVSKLSDIQKEKIQANIWKLLDYSNMFVVMLDKNLNIKIANYHLSKTLGYENEDDLINSNWDKFLKPCQNELVKHVNDEVSNGNKDYTEFSYDILDKDKNTITVKWFNTYVNSEFNCIFSIGIPLTKVPTLDEDIDSIRSYFKDILERDKTTINAMKEITLKRSEKLMEVA